MTDLNSLSLREIVDDSSEFRKTETIIKSLIAPYDLRIVKMEGSSWAVYKSRELAFQDVSYANCVRYSFQQIFAQLKGTSE